MPHVLVSAAHKSSGKTTITLGLAAALRMRGLTVQTFKKGPDYIDPMWLNMASGLPCHNLDFYTMQADEIDSWFVTYSRDKDFSLIEGNKGLYDGLDLDGSNSNAALAKRLQAPVVLVIDARGMTRGIAPLILGYQAFDKDINIGGVILNRLGGSRHEEKLRRVIEHYTDVPVIGAVHNDERMEIDERHLGLIPSNEAAIAREHIDTIGELVAEQVDLDRLCAIGDTAGKIDAPPLDIKSKPADVRIAVARDEAFGFYYAGDLQALETAGAEIVPFDTLNDKQLPENIHGLFIGGGFPEMRMLELAANTSMRASIRQAIENDLPTYAECGGLMYLCESLEWHEQSAEMVGVIPSHCIMHKKPQGRGYIRFTETDAMPWPDKPDSTIHAHEFHYSSITQPASDWPHQYAFTIERGAGIIDKKDGLVYKNLLACYAHQRDLASNHWAKRFVDFVRQHH
ncbi:MAG: cobyrinate a,c-diamide synthase [Granulosicoccaceae bacterium]|jgi:cobyrinic acid a,c-diamide synthase